MFYNPIVWLKMGGVVVKPSLSDRFDIGSARAQYIYNDLSRAHFSPYSHCSMLLVVSLPTSKTLTKIDTKQGAIPLDTKSCFS